MAPITIAHLQTLNAQRMLRWHGESTWTALQWSGAMAGESGEMMVELLGLAVAMGAKLGEAANAAKKHDRIVGQMANNDARLFGQDIPLPDQLEMYRKKIGKEVADTVIYGVLLCDAVGVDLQECIREVFNKKSEEYGFPERL